MTPERSGQLGSVLFGKFHGKRLQTSKHQPASPAELIGWHRKLPVRHSSKQCSDGDLRFQPSERCPEAVMHSLTKCYVRIWFAPEVGLSARSNCFSSRLAEARTAKTNSPRGILTPATLVSSR